MENILNYYYLLHSLYYLLLLILLLGTLVTNPSVSTWLSFTRVVTSLALPPVPSSLPSFSSPFQCGVVPRLCNDNFAVTGSQFRTLHCPFLCVGARAFAEFLVPFCPFCACGCGMLQCVWQSPSRDEFAADARCAVDSPVHTCMVLILPLFQSSPFFVYQSYDRVQTPF